MSIGLTPRNSVASAVKRGVKHRPCSLSAGVVEAGVQSLRTGAALGREGDGAAAAVLAGELAEYR